VTGRVVTGRVVTGWRALVCLCHDGTIMSVNGPRLSLAVTLVLIA
jgi:hypothetical protein